MAKTISTRVSITHIGIMGMGKHTVTLGIVPPDQRKDIPDDQISSQGDHAGEILLHIDNPAITESIKHGTVYDLTLTPRDPSSSSAAAPIGASSKGPWAKGPAPLSHTAIAPGANKIPPNERTWAETQSAAPKNADGLRTDGPTLEEFVEAGYKAEDYPPAGYATNPPAPAV